MYCIDFVILWFLGYDKEEKETLLYGLGYRQDTDGKSSCRLTTFDRPCLCKCSRCLCVQFEIPAGTAACGSLSFDDTTKRGKPRTTDQIVKIMEKVNNYNEGMFIEGDIFY